MTAVVAVRDRHGVKAAGASPIVLDVTTGRAGRVVMAEANAGLARNVAARGVMTGANSAKRRCLCRRSLLRWCLTRRASNRSHDKSK
jgi:hypothetical protein